MADGSLNYHMIGIEKPVVKVDGDRAEITYISVLNADAYGAKGTFRMGGILFPSSNACFIAV